MGKFVDISGFKYTNLEILMKIGVSDARHSLWLCQCDCGKFKIIPKCSIVTGKSRSCGCLQRKSATIHGDSQDRSSPYPRWQAMLSRCYQPTHKAYKYYGGKGIIVCDEWKIYVNFKNFALTNGWEKGMQIHRIDSNKNYEPENCRFISQKNHARIHAKPGESNPAAKLRDNEVIEIRASKLTRTNIAKKYGISIAQVYRILCNKNRKLNTEDKIC